MSRPSGLRSRNPFRKPNRKDQGAKKLDLDYEKLSHSENLRQDHRDTAADQRSFRIALARAEADGKHSAAKKLRRALNQAQEEDLWYRASWCLTCLNVLHNCYCKTRDEVGVSRSTVYRRRKKAAEKKQSELQFIHRILGGS